MLRPTLRAGLVLALLILLSVALSWALARMHPGSSAFLMGSQILLCFLVLAHGVLTLGMGRMVRFAAMTAPVAGLMEVLSLKTGLATPYVYTDVLGPRLFGLPVVVPMGWVALLYLSQWVTNLILDGDGRRVSGSGMRQVLASLLTALVLTAYDLTMDPFMVYGAKAWVWQQPGGFLGIPFANYVSWVEVGFMLNLAWRLWDRDLGAEPEPAPSRWMAALPALVFGFIGMSDVFVGVPMATRVLAPFCMATGVLAALGRVFWPSAPDPSTLASENLGGEA